MPPGFYLLLILKSKRGDIILKENYQIIKIQDSLIFKIPRSSDWQMMLKSRNVFQAKIISRAWSRDEAKEVAVSSLLKTSGRSKSVSR